MDLDIAKLVERYKKDKIKEYQDTNKTLFNDIKTYITKNGGLVSGIMALSYIANKAKIPFNTEDKPFYIFVIKARDYVTKMAEKLSKKHSGLSISSNFKEEYDLLHNNNIVATFNGIGEKTLKILPRFEGIYAAPIILSIENLLVMTDPQEGVEKWLEVYKMDNLLNYIEPFKPKKDNSKNIINIPESHVPKILQKVYEWIKSHNKIFIGLYAYLFYMYESGYNKPMLIKLNGKYVPNYEILSYTPKEDIKQLIELFGKNNIKVKENYSDLNFHGNKFSISYKKAKILDIYDISKYCVPYITKNNKFYGNFYIVLLYLNLGILTAYQISNVNETASTALKNRINTMLYDLYNAREMYLLKHGITGISTAEDEEYNLFNVFQMTCIGTQANFRREWNIKKWNGKTKRYFVEF